MYAFFSRDQPTLPAAAQTLDQIEQQVNGKGDRSEEDRDRRDETPPGEHLLMVARRSIKNPVTSPPDRPPFVSFVSFVPFVSFMSLF